jgi:GT2 family glycosyltransferase
MKNTNLLTVILNIYKRPNLISKQLDALKNQSIKPNAVLIWKNHAIEKSVNDLFDQKFYPFEIITAECNSNLGVWARFAFALNAKTEYVCVLDDDVVPGKKWFENCLQQMIKEKVFTEQEG